jgi:hypothetical protein
MCLDTWLDETEKEPIISLDCRITYLGDFSGGFGVEYSITWVFWGVNGHLLKSY